jgi:hypothetical protein
VSSHCHSWLWCQPTLLLIVSHDTLPWGKPAERVQLTISVYLVSGLTSHLPYVLMVCVIKHRDNFTFM